MKSGSSHFLLPVFLIVASLASAQEKKITLYTDDFRGSEATFAVGRYDYFTLVRAGVSVIRSARIPAGMKVTLYKEDNFTGKTLVLTEDANEKYIQAKGFGQLQDNVSVVVALALVEPVGPAITVYKDNFSGPSRNLGPGYHDAADFGEVGNDQVSSIVIPKGLKVTLYEHGGFKGRTLELTADVSAGELARSKFNDATSSLRIEVVASPAVVPPAVPVIVPAVPETGAPGVNAPAADTSVPAVIIYQGDFNGTQKALGIGRYNVEDLGIGSDELSSVEIQENYRVTLFDKAGFKGKSLRLTRRTGTQQLSENGFNNLTSSVVVEEVPRASVYQGDFGDFAFRLLPGKYDGLYLDQLGLLDNEVSSVKVPPGMSVILYEDDRFKGRAIHFTHDMSTDSLVAKKFNNTASSIEVTEDLPVELPGLQVTLYADNFTGTSKQLGVGNFDHADLRIGNNTLSAISIPRGLQVTLFEHGAFEGRSLVLARSVGPDVLGRYGFDDAVSSLKVEEIAPEDLVVTIYSGSFSGRSQQLAPGRYNARELTIGDKQLTSLKVPKGMRATLFADWNFKGVTVMIDRDDDFTDSKLFDNYYRSIVVEDVREAVLSGTPLPAPTPVEPVVVPVVPIVPVQQPAPDTVHQVMETMVITEDACLLSDAAFEDGLRAVQSKPFMEEKMEMAKLVTRDKCLTNNQIRRMALDFKFEDQALEFTEYAYPLARDKDTYYKLESIFKFGSTREKFIAFLKSR